MTFLDVPGARLHDADAGGDGEPVVFVHPAAAYPIRSSRPYAIEP